MNFLLSYDYPGNIRELRNIIERLIVLSDDGVIRKKYLPEYQKNSCYRSLTLKEYRELVEKDYIEKTLLEFDLDKDLASDFLGISKRQLYNNYLAP